MLLWVVCAAVVITVASSLRYDDQELALQILSDLNRGVTLALQNNLQDKIKRTPSSNYNDALRKYQNKWDMEQEKTKRILQEMLQEYHKEQNKTRFEEKPNGYSPLPPPVSVFDIINPGNDTKNDRNDSISIKDVDFDKNVVDFIRDLFEIHTGKQQPNPSNSNNTFDYNQNPMTAERWKLINLTINELPTNFEVNNFQYDESIEKFSAVQKDKVECKAGTEWLSNCHKCMCSDNGLSFCHRLRNCFIRSLDEPMPCKPYTKFDLDECNRCTCNGDGIPVCTLMKCKNYKKQDYIRDADLYEKASSEINGTPIPPSWDYDEKTQPSRPILTQSLSNGKKRAKCSWEDLPTCQPGSTWISNCFQCNCDAKGRRVCAEIASCSPLPLGLPGRCQPGSSFGNGCKMCTCNDEGYPDCIYSDNC